MIIHIPITGLRMGTTDIEKKMPHVAKIFPDAKISKQIEPEECIKASGIKKDLKLIKLFNKKLDVDIKIDLYALSSFSYAYFDIYFEADLELFELLTKDKGIIWNLIFYGEVDLSKGNQNFTTIFTQILIRYYNLEKIREIKDSLNPDLSNISKNIDILFEKTGERFYCIEEPVTGMLSLGPMGSRALIEDYNNYIDINNECWEPITNSKNDIYHDDSKGYFICKKENVYKDIFDHFYIQAIYINKLMFIRNSPCMAFLNTIRRKGVSIRKNIAENHQNPYYWKELKKEIEILDLNFLEFHTEAIKSTIVVHDSLDVNKKYRDQSNDTNKIAMERTLQFLNEIKYAISNLSTPSHVHDEEILQTETEKVNDRILMFTFIAMAVSAIGMMQSTEIALEFKILSGAGIFSLPALYYLFRGIQKKLSFRKNKINELKRVITNKTEIFNSRKAYLDILINEKSDDKNFPEGFKEELIKFMSKDLDDEEQAITKLKEKL